MLTSPQKCAGTTHLAALMSQLLQVTLPRMHELRHLISCGLLVGFEFGPVVVSSTRTAYRMVRPGNPAERPMLKREVWKSPRG